MSKEVKTALETMTLERGKKIGNYWVADFSVKEVLERVGKKNTPVEQNYIRYVIQQQYAGSKILLGQGDNGGFIHMKIRSI
jgi:hypothetical protein